MVLITNIIVIMSECLSECCKSEAGKKLTSIMKRVMGVIGGSCIGEGNTVGIPLASSSPSLTVLESMFVVLGC